MKIVGVIFGFLLIVMIFGLIVISDILIFLSYFRNGLFVVVGKKEKKVIKKNYKNMIVDVCV